MNKIKLTNGWTKESVMAQIKKYNDGNVSVDKDGNCLYEHPITKNRCAIGCFIPDGHEALKDNITVGALLREYPDLLDKMPFKDIESLTNFQLTHDLLSNHTDSDEETVYKADEEAVYKAIDNFLDTYDE